MRTQRRAPHVQILLVLKPNIKHRPDLDLQWVAASFEQAVNDAVKRNGSTRTTTFIQPYLVNLFSNKHNSCCRSFSSFTKSFPDSKTVSWTAASKPVATEKGARIWKLFGCDSNSDSFHKCDSEIDSQRQMENVSDSTFVLVLTTHNHSVLITILIFTRIFSVAVSIDSTTCLLSAAWNWRIPKFLSN